jgi:hypothetical protein
MYARTLKLWFCSVALLTLLGCAQLTAQKGGHSKIDLGGGLKGNPSVTGVQSDNPAQPTTTRAVERKTVVIPSGSTVTTTTKDGASVTVTTSEQTTLTEEREAETTIGAAQKDTSRSDLVALNSLKPVQFVGIILILAALAMFHPFIFGIVGSRTLQVACGAVGVLLVFAPVLVVGNEPLILGLCCGGLLLWWLAHRKGQQSQQIATLMEEKKKP